jgi:hypothetical protein
MMKITKPDSRSSGAIRQANYRAKHGKEYREKETTRMRRTRAIAIPEFVGVDSEGIGKGSHHRAVLLGVGKEQFVARDLDKGLQYAEVFEFLYSQFERKPGAAYVGFYLAYDFNQWLRSLPRSAAWLLLSKAGKAKRQINDGKKRRRMMYPVHVDDEWDIDMLGFKRLSIRPRVCDCYEKAIECKHEQKGWMHICDAGSFYQMSFARTCNPAMWAQDPDGPICTQAEWDKLFAGKERRAYAKLDQQMKEYNALENELLARCMSRLARGFLSIGIRLAKDEWYGPGATASKWLRQKGAIKHQDLPDLMPQYFEDICRKSYYGGWFEIFSHGIIEGESWNYDINNAYPYATTKLPHICRDTKYRQGHGAYTGNGNYVLLYGTVHAANERIGPVPYRDKNGSILRPSIAKGWYWKHELDAANRAGLIKRSFIDEWVEFVPCNHPAPFADIRDLYNLRLSVGKNSAQGLAIKLNNNSCYGKFAQSTGSAPFNNWLYASLITAHCRVQILDAIASHPDKANSVLMVATDGVLFDSRHPGLPISKQLGEWEETTYTDVCLFKPGVYWHREGKEALLKVKSRGVPKAEFMAGVDQVEEYFRAMQYNGYAPGQLYEGINEEGYSIELRLVWPWFRVPINFRMKSCTQALNERKWNHAGEVQESVSILQDSNPHNKRRRARYNLGKRRIDTVIHDLSIFDTETRYYGEVRYKRAKDLGYAFDGHPIDGILEAAETLRTKPANYDIPIGDEYEWETIWGEL